MASLATLLVTAFWTIDPFTTLIVTTFTAGAQNTLPLWIFGAIRLGQRLPEVDVVVSFVVLITIIPVLIAARLTGGGATRRLPAVRE
jgi:ABC-type spermidine/putrescine transport system permease subunit II